MWSMVWCWVWRWMLLKNCANHAWQKSVKIRRETRLKPSKRRPALTFLHTETHTGHWTWTILLNPTFLWHLWHIHTPQNTRTLYCVLSHAPVDVCQLCTAEPPHSISRDPGASSCTMRSSDKKNGIQKAWAASVTHAIMMPLLPKLWVKQGRQSSVSLL